MRSTEKMYSDDPNKIRLTKMYRNAVNMDPKANANPTKDTDRATVSVCWEACPHVFNPCSV
jgi:hypothetical protein